MKPIMILLLFILIIPQIHATIRWGILSTARFNDRIIETIKHSKNSEVIAVSSRSLEKAQEFAKKRNIPIAYGSYEELIVDPNIDVIYNPLPNFLHTEWTVKAIKAGKHVLCEKPMCITLEEFEEIEKAIAILYLAE